jgi:hypothetical protein
MRGGGREVRLADSQPSRIDYLYEFQILRARLRKAIMNQDSLITIRERVVESTAQNQRLKALLPTSTSQSLRAAFARSAIDLAQEHHSGLIRVVRAGEYGTAAALLRPTLEASTSAFWLIYIASCENIRGLPTSLVENESADIPMLGEMALSLVPIFPPIQTLVDGLKKGGQAKWLHKYTHGGTPQLIRRNSGWTEGEVMLTLIRADMFAILGACLETVIEKNSLLSEYAFGRRDDLGKEFHVRFNGPLIPPQPHSLPAGLVDGCGPPFF